MAENYVLLETIQLTESAASVTFDNIPQTGYTDLKVVMSARNAYSGGGAANCYLTFNGNGASYSGKYITGNGASASSAGNTGGTSVIYIGAIENNSWTANTFGNLEIYIPNYTSSNNKSISWDSVTENNATTAYAQFGAGLWSNSAAITSITFTPESATGDWVQYSTFSLYGLAALGTTPTVAPLATGGNIVANDGTYWYHAFLSSGTFTPQISLTADCLVIAGGGGAGAGGGGAGGLLYSAAQSLTAQNYSVIIGAGGTAGTNGSPSTNGANGSNSVFNSLTAIGGGGGGGNLVGTAPSGGSGGGGGNTDQFQTYGGAGTSGQGNAGGGNGNFRSANYPTGGGGGAGAAGGNATGNFTSGAGGNGVNTYASWANATGTGADSGYYAGGGGGGMYNSSSTPTGAAGGLGGGGRGSQVAVNAAGLAGTANTGGGAGGGNAAGMPSGGSGIVIIRYSMA